MGGAIWRHTPFQKKPLLRKMKPISRPQHYRVRRILQLVREGISSGRLANSSDFMADLGISRRTVARDLDFLRDEERLIGSGISTGSA